jgi:hypothetical protein
LVETERQRLWLKPTVAKDREQEANWQLPHFAEMFCELLNFAFGVGFGTIPTECTR